MPSARRTPGAGRGPGEDLSFSNTVNLPPGPQPGGSCPLVTFPLTSPHLTTADLTTPHNISLHLTSAHLTSPHITSPHLTTPLRPPSGPVFYESKLTFSLFHFSSLSLLSSSLFSSLLAIFARKTRPDPPPDPKKVDQNHWAAHRATPPWTAFFAQGAQDRLKTRQREPLSRARRAQDGPRPSQDRPKKGQDPFKTAPRRPKTFPRPPQDGPRRPKTPSRSSQDRPQTPQIPSRGP